MRLNMQGKKLFYFIGGIVVVIVLWIMADTMMQPGVGDLKGDFQEVSFYRNENNTGPVIRVYAVYTSDSLWAEMRQYGDYMPHTKYGNTKVFFFRDKANVPQSLKGNEPYFNEALQNYCIAKYEKSAMGDVKFTKNPFR
ncbi:hypothetical protein [Mongoliibacter ruber]|uniref:Uncharacterized protein n=1 Tax=Mongoliibacter ruber TaxID=1750599 RepID=A0A2T0WLH8_9BACT|nr:hypothetical protein [Mongoliibacter ruber]PRY87535.1 hypothetical protein CLW00_106161 [Mongoliibacter ruber]